VERLGTNGRVVEAQVVQKCIIAKESIVAGVATFLTNGSRLRRKCKPREREQCERGISNIRYCFHVL